MEEFDLMESTAKEIDPDDDVEVFRMKKQHFQAAKKYLVCLNLSKYSVEKGDEFEITLNKKAESSIISQIKDFKSEEIPISNYERSLSAMNILSENYLNVHFIISRNTLLLYGLKRDVSSAKIDLLAQLGDPDEINMGMTDSTAKSFGGKAASGQSSQEKDLNITQTKSYTLIDTPTNSYYGKVSIPVESNLFEKTYVESISAESAPTRRGGEKETCKTGIPGFSNVLKQTRPQFYVGHKTDLKVYVRKEDITKLDVDIIVNGANRHLRHGGGVSRAVAVAAGQSLVNECNSYIAAHGPLDVTDVFVSTGGLLRATYVIHAAGPKWESYADKHRCLTDLRRTVVRCLVQASRLQKGSVALPSISSAIFKVPKELCAQCYMDAVKHFDDFAEKLGVVPVKDVRFVDIDDAMVNIILEKFIKEWHKPVDEKISKGDFEFSQQHLSKRYDDTFGCSTGSSAFQKKFQQPSSQGTKSGEESHKIVSQGVGANTISYQVNSIEIHIVTKPATAYRSAIVVIGKLFDELSGIKKFNVCDLVKPRYDLPKQKKSFQYLSLSKPDGSQPTLICQLHPNPDNPENVTKAFENLGNAEEIHRSQTVVFTSAILYNKPKKGQDNNKIISRIAQKVFDFAAVTSSTNSAIKSILFATDAECIPIVIKLFDSRRVQKIQPGQTSRDLDSSVNSQDCCCVCFERINIQSLKCCQALLCSTCLGKVSFCPVCRYHFKILTGGQPKGEMNCFYSSQDVEGYERKGSLEINYFIPAGIQTEELQHPSPGKPYTSVTRTAFLPATDDGYRALRLLRVAFHRRLIFTIDVSQTTQVEGIVWNIHHKTSRNSSAHGYPDPTYVTCLMYELRQYGVTEDSVTVDEKRLVEKFMEDLVSSVDSQDCCSVCFESINIESLKCCQGLICSTCLSKNSICPFCRFHLKIIMGKQPQNGEMRWRYSPLDVDGYEKKGSLVIDYYFPAGKQIEELRHPSPGKPYTSVTRTAYLPATDDGYRALRLLRVAFHRRLIFTIDVSHTTQMEGIVWNIHHKTKRHSSDHGYPDLRYLMSLMFELSQSAVTEHSMTQEEMRLVDEFMASLRKNMDTRV